jgi:epoxyqueuosine reductase
VSVARIAKSLYTALEKKGFKGSIIPIKRITDLKREIEGAHKKGVYDGTLYQERLTDFDFGVKERLPEAKSIIITSAPQPQQKVRFDFKGKSYHFTIPPTYSYKTDEIVGSIFSDILKPEGMNLHPAKLPLKLLAVRAGLAQYGRNNIAYVEGMGSFHRLKAFLSELTPVEDKWGEPQSLELCNKCSACIKICPTAAIVSDRFLIRAERCLTFHNERKDAFPGWIDSSWHNCLIGCMVCQSACPANEKFYNWFEETERFTEKETDLILRGTRRPQLPKNIINKLQRLNLLEDFDLLPRNLDVLVKQQLSSGL